MVASEAMRHKHIKGMFFCEALFTRTMIIIVQISINQQLYMHGIVDGEVGA